MRILSWNIAGIRAKLKKNLLDFLIDSNIAIVCFQETKGSKEEIERLICFKLKNQFPYRYYNFCNGEGNQRKGLNGVAIWSKFKAYNLLTPLSCAENEGRVIGINFGEFKIINVYTPNGQCYNSSRFKFRINEWDIQFKNWVNKFKNENTIICGDFNVAYQNSDLHPKWWNIENLVGASNEERKNFKNLKDDGWVDSYNMEKNPKKIKYTNWDQRIKQYRKKNIGWRIDYFLTSRKISKLIIKNKILDNIVGSDHCPIKLKLNLKYKSRKLIID